jgi:hypothetical protein
VRYTHTHTRARAHTHTHTHITLGSLYGADDVAELALALYDSDDSDISAAAAGNDPAAVATAAAAGSAAAGDRAGASYPSRPSRTGPRPGGLRAAYVAALFELARSSGPG